MSIKYSLGKFPIKVWIAKEVAGTIVWQSDMARRIIEDGNEFYWLKKEKKKIPPAEYQQMGLGSNGRRVLFLYSPSTEVYVPFEFDHDAETKKAKARISEDSEFKKAWRDYNYKRAYIKYPDEKSFFEKYLPVIMVIALGLSLMFLYIGWSYVQAQQVAFAQAYATQNAELLNALRNATALAKGSGIQIVS